MDGEDIIGGYVGIEKHDCRFMFLQCLPSDTDHMYHVSRDGKAFEKAPERDIWNYPVIKVNTYEDDCFSTVSDQGIGLLAFEIPFSEDYKVKLSREPSFVSVWENRIQIMFRLKNYVPTEGVATEVSLNNLDGTISKVEAYLQGRYTEDVLNPLSNDVTSYIFIRGGMSLATIRRAIYVKASPAEMKLARAKGGRAAAAARSYESKQQIVGSIVRLQREGKRVNQTSVAKLSGLHLKTVQRHWAGVKADHAELFSKC